MFLGKITWSIIGSPFWNFYLFCAGDALVMSSRMQDLEVVGMDISQ